MPRRWRNEPRRGSCFMACVRPYILLGFSHTARACNGQRDHMNACMHTVNTRATHGETTCLHGGLVCNAWHEYTRAHTHVHVAHEYTRACNARHEYMRARTCTYSTGAHMHGVNTRAHTCTHARTCTLAYIAHAARTYMAHMHECTHAHMHAYGHGAHACNARRDYMSTHAMHAVITRGRCMHTAHACNAWRAHTRRACVHTHGHTTHGVNTCTHGTDKYAGMQRTHTYTARTAHA
jgi:hypothetical protein